HDLQADLLLHRDGVANALILNRREAGVVDLPGVIAESLTQRGRPQQAADVVGAKRGAAVRTRTHDGLQSCLPTFADETGFAANRLTSSRRLSFLYGAGATVARICFCGIPGRPQTTLTSVPSAHSGESSTQSESIWR